ncbi:hypothetical protein J3V39_004532 [Salmonella enterica]|nr:hypothetical protein [Salmonella enterica]EMB5928187.1 phage DNA packaging protein J [Klebsiella pneumoniae]
MAKSYRRGSSGKKKGSRLWYVGGSQF